LTIFIDNLLDNAIQVIRREPIVTGRAVVRYCRRSVRRAVDRAGVGILYMADDG
jgi:hypothetical protein